ncbi:hypothetical protein F8388_010828 [Cannabis sativa]|uniref:Uncharacterized protein n=1 Tax=Cannabis sativa TaxID=3483 RepID=A0A7J6HCJ2_CANSA|nr:hypothetical protein F8388_010828 [Cannabis sativa]
MNYRSFSLSLKMQKQNWREDSLEMLQKTCHFAQLIKPRYDIASVIRDIKKSLREIKERGQSYGLRPFEQGSSSNKNVDAFSMGTQLGSLYIEEDDLINWDNRRSNRSFEELLEDKEVCHVIVAVAGLLSTKEKIEFEWQKVIDNLNYEFEINPQLNDYLIFDQRLYRIWIAEGFIESKRDNTLKKVAQEYLNELIHRNLVSFHIIFGFQRWCYVHDLLFEIILTKVDAMCFSHMLNTSKAKFKGRSRRLSVFSTTKDVQEIVRDSKVRSVIFHNVDQLIDSFVTGLFKELKLLKLLDFEGAPLYDIPKEVGHLFHLKYLNLKGTHVKRLPKSIGSLYNLQVLNLFNTFIKELPIEINKLQNFQHLLGHRYINRDECSVKSYGDVKIHPGIGCLKELQTLTFVEAYKNGVDFVKELQKLTKLVSLGIGKVTTEMGKSLTISIGKMSHLEELFITYFRDEEILDFERISSPPPSLRFISLRLRNEPLRNIKDLPSLEFIRLHQAYDGEELHFEEGSFRRLKHLIVGKLEGLKVLKMDRGSLPHREQLGIIDCLSLK